MGPPLNRLRPLRRHFKKRLAALGVIGRFGESSAVVRVLLVNFDFGPHRTALATKFKKSPVSFSVGQCPGGESASQIFCASWPAHKYAAHFSTDISGGVLVPPLPSLFDEDALHPDVEIVRHDCVPGLVEAAGA
jgi:hypothetical protein